MPPSHNFPRPPHVKNRKLLQDSKLFELFEEADMASTHTTFSCPEIPLQHEAIKSPAHNTGEDYCTLRLILLAYVRFSALQQGHQLS